MALKSVSEELLLEWDRWSQQSTKYKPGECEYKWDTFRGGVTIGTLYYFARLDSASVHICNKFPIYPNASALPSLNSNNFSFITMTTKQKTKSTFQSISAEALGEYGTEDHYEKLYSTVYYTIRELQGLSVKRSLGDDFSWDELKSRFEDVFGKIEERRFSLEQLLEYAARKFGKTLEQLMADNDKSWKRRREWKEKAKAAQAYQAYQELNDTEF